LFVFSDRDFATGKQVFFKGGDRVGELISTHLSRHRLTSGFLNVPMTYPAECEAGSFMISGLDAPSLNDRAFCPAELRDELFSRFRNYSIGPRDLGDLMRAGRLDEATAAWMKLIEIQTAAAEYLIDKYPVDFFMTVYTASDWAGHNLWKYHDRLDGEAKCEANPLLDVYRELDSAIGKLLTHASDDTQSYVISDHGMGPHSGASYHLAEWLETSGYMVRSGRSRTRDSIIGVGRRAARSLLPDSVRERLKAEMGDERLSRLQAAEKDSFYSSIDWERTSAYTEPGRHVININLKGRNSAGSVSQSDYEGVCLGIIEDLSQWTDARGNKVVSRVVRRTEVYAGPFTERASDLHVYWNPAAVVGEPPDEVRARGFWWSGDHRLEGILICKGPGIRANTRLGSAAVYDFVPTVTYAAGLPVPRGLDGRMIQELFTDEFLTAHPLQLDSAGSASTTDQVPISVEEQQMIEEKLRSLGYL
jgi:predicted AlkP superfamily phosphohydrolase/phosphomutase